VNNEQQMLKNQPLHSMLIENLRAHQI